MTKHFLLSSFLSLVSYAAAQPAAATDSARQVVLWPDEAYPATATDSVMTYRDKLIYIPTALRTGGLDSDTARWSVRRMFETRDVAIFWEPGFGGNVTTAPDLDGHNMKVDIANLVERLQYFYHFYRDTLGWTRPGSPEDFSQSASFERSRPTTVAPRATQRPNSKADRYKMMVMLRYDLEGTAYGGDYDGQIGALWITPGRVQDKALNCIAHELGHCFQAQIVCDGAGECWGGDPIYESCAQWMLWQVNPDWQTSENYHLQAYQKLTHKALGSMENIYHTAYYLELWAEKHGRTFIADLFRAGRRGEDPVETYKRLTNQNQQQFCDELFTMQRKLVNWDIKRIYKESRPYANQWHTPMAAAAGGWRAVADSVRPEQYGLNFVELTVPKPGAKVSVSFEGDAGVGWRYGLVAVDAAGTAHYGSMSKATKGQATYSVPKGSPLSHLWLVVMPAPAEHKHLVAEEGETQPAFAWRIKGMSVKE